MIYWLNRLFRSSRIADLFTPLFTPARFSKLENSRKPCAIATSVDKASDDNDNYRSFPAIRLFSVDPCAQTLCPVTMDIRPKRSLICALSALLFRRQICPRLEHDLSSQEAPGMVAPSDELRDPFGCC